MRGERSVIGQGVRACALVAAVLVVAVACAWPVSAARQDANAAAAFALDRTEADVEARLVAIEHAEGVLFGTLAAATGPVDESALLRQLIRRVAEPAAATRADAESDHGFATLGTQAAAIIRNANAFHRGVVAIYAGTPPAERKGRLDVLLQEYRGRAALALPDAPKDMTILYDHPYTSFVPPVPPETEPRRQLTYPRLTAFVWSSHWYALAVIDALDPVDADERARRLAIVAERFKRKLPSEAAQDEAPTELPLTPAIAPGLVSLHDRSAAIIDNLNVMTDVIGDLLTRAPVAERRTALNQVMAQFTDRQYRCVQADEWIVVALRHSIFAQGGPAVGTMAGYERNAFFGGHGQHYTRRAPPPCDQ